MNGEFPARSYTLNLLCEEMEEYINSLCKSRYWELPLSGLAGIIFLFVAA